MVVWGPLYTGEIATNPGWQKVDQVGTPSYEKWEDIMI